MFHSMATPKYVLNAKRFGSASSESQMRKVSCKSNSLEKRVVSQRTAKKWGSMDNCIYMSGERDGLPFARGLLEAFVQCTRTIFS